MNRFRASVIIHGKIECMTGLHIGGSGGGYEIGGVENSVIRNPIDDYPYIPGSSLKGKMRSLMEWALGKIAPDGEIYAGKHAKNPADDELLRIFGSPADDERKVGPARLTVRDAVPDEATRQIMRELEKQGLPKVEIKTEVTLNRITSKPLSGPRQIERVPVGSRFDFELVYAIYEVDGLRVKDIDLLDRVFFALRLVEDSALGGGGSRGSGQVRFRLGEPLIKTVQDYQFGSSASKSPRRDAEIDAFKTLDNFSDEEINKLKKRLRERIERAPKPDAGPEAEERKAPEQKPPEQPVEAQRDEEQKPQAPPVAPPVEEQKIEEPAAPPLEQQPGEQSQ